MTRIRAHTWQWVEADMVELGLYVHPEVVSPDDAIGRWTLSAQCGRAVVTTVSREQCEDVAHRLAAFHQDWRTLTEWEARSKLMEFPGGIAKLTEGKG